MTTNTDSDKRTVDAVEWRRKSRRNFLTAGALGVLGALGGTWVLTRPEEQGVAWPLRAMYRFNEKVFRGAYSNNALGESPKAPPAGTVPRVNGDVGLPAEVDYDKWRLAVTTRPEGKRGDPATLVTYEQ